jgi:hypothetical protein
LVKILKAQEVSDILQDMPKVLIKSTTRRCQEEDARYCIRLSLMIYISAITMQKTKQPKKDYGRRIVLNSCGSSVCFIVSIIDKI